jgi:hypothetical protein
MRLVREVSKNFVYFRCESQKRVKHGNACWGEAVRFAFNLLATIASLFFRSKFLYYVAIIFSKDLQDE